MYQKGGRRNPRINPDRVIPTPSLETRIAVLEKLVRKNEGKVIHAVLVARLEKVKEERG